MVEHTHYGEIFLKCTSQNDDEGEVEWTHIRAASRYSTAAEVTRLPSENRLYLAGGHGRLWLIESPTHALYMYISPFWGICWCCF